MTDCFGVELAGILRLMGPASLHCQASVILCANKLFTVVRSYWHSSEEHVQLFSVQHMKLLLKGPVTLTFPTISQQHYQEGIPPPLGPVTLISASQN